MSHLLAIQTKVHIRLSCTGPPIIRPRTVVTNWEIGLISTKFCNHVGIVLGSTKVLLANDNGSTIRNMIPCTAPDVRAFIPTKTEIQQKQSAKAIEMPIPAVAAIALVSMRKPISMPNPSVTTHRIR